MTRTHYAILAALVVADIVMSAIMAQRLPERVPLHWNIHGEVDRYGAPTELTVLLPMIVATSAVMLAGIGTLKAVGRAFGPPAIAIVGLFVGMHGLALAYAAGYRLPVASSAFVLAAAMLAVVGNSLGKVRRNSLYGIRTPWTLASDVVWERTHRIGSRLMVAHAFAMAAAAIWLPAWAAFATLIGGAIALCAWAMLYSRRLSRRLGATP
jgi:uncharacterized membrane protein